MTRSLVQTLETSDDLDIGPGVATGGKAAGSATACMELDRFCEECSYNLRTLPVTTDPRTGIPVVRCTECGRFQPANTAATALRPWLARVTSVSLFGWMFLLFAVFFWLGMAQGAINYATLDELTISGTRRIERVNKKLAAAGITTTITYTGAYGPIQVREHTPDYDYFMPFMLSVSFLIAMVTAVICVVVFPHWTRWVYFAPVFGMSLVAAAFVAVTWHYEAEPLMGWATPYMLGHLGAQLLGGTVGIVAGRPMTRLTIRMMLPPSVRPRLAYLWLADGKGIPSR